MEIISYIKRETSDKQGNALKTRDNRPYTRVVIKVESKGDRFISGFGNAGNEKWSIGDEVDVTITESDKKDSKGNAYLNFSMPKVTDKIDDKLEMILNRMVGLQLSLAKIEAYLVPKKNVAEVEYPQGEDDQPF